MTITLNGIKRRGDAWKGYANWSRRKVLIWSQEHCAWWRPKCQGYTDKRDHAGIYFFNDALYITESCGREKKIAFHSIGFI